MLFCCLRLQRVLEARGTGVKILCAGGLIKILEEHILIKKELMLEQFDYIVIGAGSAGCDSKSLGRRSKKKNSCIRGWGK